MNIKTEAISTLLVGVKFLDLDIKYWGLDSLNKITSILSILIQIDKYTKDKVMLKYARVLIDMPLEGPIREYIKFCE